VDPKNIRFSPDIIYEATKYSKISGLTFSQIVRLALQQYLKQKLYSNNDW
jgi:hypothetical protein